jgi:hypothetical protein
MLEIILLDCLPVIPLIILILICHFKSAPASRKNTEACRKMEEEIDNAAEVASEIIERLHNRWGGRFISGEMWQFVHIILGDADQRRVWARVTVTKVSVRTIIECSWRADYDDKQLATRVSVILAWRTHTSVEIHSPVSEPTRCDIDPSSAGNNEDGSGEDGGDPANNWRYEV